MPCYAMPCYATLCCAMLCYAVLCYAMLCYAMLCHAMLCFAMLGTLVLPASLASVRLKVTAAGPPCAGDSAAASWRLHGAVQFGCSLPGEGLLEKKVDSVAWRSVA